MVTTGSELSMVNPYGVSVQRAVENHNILVQVAQELMQEGIDYGVIPGTAKPTLLKPGAEKLCHAFSLAPSFEILHSIVDFTGETTGGEPLFFYQIKCLLRRGGELIAEGTGSCNSWEKKYRWREAKLLCPQCGKATVIKGKAEYGGGWLCWAKKGGCGAKYQANEPAIVEQDQGQIPNPDIFDVVNTVEKMAAKRALVAATLIAAGASELYTQDTEDMVIIDVTPQPQVERQAPAPLPVPSAPELEQAHVAHEMDLLRKLRADLRAAGGIVRDLGTTAQVSAWTDAERKGEIARTKREIELMDQTVLSAPEGDE
jgi:hypothetical protein